jgi:hypothetical protein
MSSAVPIHFLAHTSLVPVLSEWRSQLQEEEILANPMDIPHITYEKLMGEGGVVVLHLATKCALCS